MNLRSQRLLHDDEIHRREDAEITAFLEVDRSLQQHGVHGLRPLGREADELEHAGEDVRQVRRPASRFHDLLPRNGSKGGAIKSKLHVEARRLRGFNAIFDGAHFRQCVTFSDAIDDVDVNLIIRVVLIGAQPLVGRKEGTRFEDLEHLLVQSSGVRRVARGFNGIRAVKGSTLEHLREVHEVTLNDLRQIFQASLLVQSVAAANLVLIDSDTSHLTARGLDDVAHRTPNAAAKVQHVHPRLQTNVLRDRCACKTGKVASVECLLFTDMRVERVHGFETSDARETSMTYRLPGE